MMNYKLVDAGHTLFNIVETKTDQIVAWAASNHSGQAKALCRHLNMGGGFDGWTPSFFLERIAVSDLSGE